MKRTVGSLLLLAGLLVGIALLEGCFVGAGDMPIDAVAAPLFISFVNESDDLDLPDIFVFVRNGASSGALTDEVAWRVMPNLAKGSSSTFMVLPMNTLQAEWGEDSSMTALVAEVGTRYTVMQDNTGIVLAATGNASQSNAIEIGLQAVLDGGIQAQLLNDGKSIMEERVVAYGQKAMCYFH